MQFVFPMPGRSLQQGHFDPPAEGVCVCGGAKVICLPKHKIRIRTGVCCCAQFGIFCNGGQVCSATSRLLLHRDIASDFLQKLRDRAESIQVGDPLEKGCRLGPLVSEGQHQKVLAYIEVTPPALPALPFSPISFHLPTLIPQTVISIGSLLLMSCCS